MKTILPELFTGDWAAIVSFPCYELTENCYLAVDEVLAEENTIFLPSV